MKLEELSIRSFAEGLRRKQFSALEVTEAYLKAIQERDGVLHSYLFVADEVARASAQKIDEALASGDLSSPLAGVPFAVKDNIAVEGLPSTAGSRILEPYIASYDAGVIRRLKSYGAVILGKTNLDEFAMGSSTENSAFGATKNPADLTRVPGGSSGGSAAAVAGNLALAAIGSDTGGSIRQPAAFCGVVGLKPTYGRVSRHGLIAMASSLDQVGPFGKCVDDAAIIYRAIAGHDRYDATSVPRDVEGDKQVSLTGIKIGVPKEYFAEGLNPDVARRVHSALGQVEAAGATLVEISLPHARYALPAYYVIMFAEVSANLARFDGLRYGFRASSPTLHALYEETRNQGFGREVKRRIMLGTYVLSHGYYDAYYVKAQKVRRLIRHNFAEAFKKVDVIMGPTTPGVAFKFGAMFADPLSMYLEDIYTVAINLAGLPALSMPCGRIADEGKELPVGLQLIGPWFDEAKLLGIAEACESVLGFRV